MAHTPSASSRRRRIVFLDVDGTLIDHGEQIADSTIRAVRMARAAGHLVYVCTGRATSEIYPSIREIGFDGTISAGGGFVQIGDELVISRTIPVPAVERMVDYYESNGLDFYLQSYDRVYPSTHLVDRLAEYLDAARTERATAGVQASSAGSAVHAAAPQDPADHPLLRAFAAPGRLRFEGVAKSVFIGTDLGAYERVSAAFAGEFDVITGTMPHAGTGGGEVTLSGVNKGTSIAMLLERMGIPREDAIGIGDSNNDLEMLAYCGVGIAMGNAMELARSHADEVTTAVLDDGIWNAFTRHGLV